MLPSTSSWRSWRLEQRTNHSNKVKPDPLLVEPTPEQCVVQDPYASALLRLPPEIRIAILEYLIPPPPKTFKIYTDCNPAMASKRWDRYRDPRPRKTAKSSFTSKQRQQRYRIPGPPLSSRFTRDSLAILRTTRLIYYESLPMLYSQTTFHFIGSNFLPILDFFRGLSPIARERVRHIKVTMLADGRDLKRTHLDMFSNVMQELIPSLNFLDLSPIVVSPALDTGDLGLGRLKIRDSE
jgi:hypothetical protein